MSIRPLLIVAGLLSVGACAGWGPTGTCYFDEQAGNQVCTSDQSTPQGTAQSGSTDQPIITPPFLPEN